MEKRRGREALESAVDEYGFLPIFINFVPGFSIEEHVSQDAWFSDEEGVWEWKGPVIREMGCAYGKFFENKAAFVSREWFPDFANISYLNSERHEDLRKHEQSVIAACSIRDKSSKG